MTNFKLTDENGVEWVKVEKVMPKFFRDCNHLPVIADGLYYIHPDDLPKPKDRFEEMAEKAIANIGRHLILVPTVDGPEITFNPKFLSPEDACDCARSWFVAHARKIDADATVRTVSAERKFLLETRQIHVVRDSPLWDRLSNRVYELSKQ